MLKTFKNAMRGLSCQKCQQIGNGLFVLFLMYKSLLYAEQVVDSGELSLAATRNWASTHKDKSSGCTPVARVIFKESYICSTYITYICWEFGRRPNSKKLYMLGIYNWKSCYICWAKKLYKLYMFKEELYIIIF